MTSAPTDTCGVTFILATHNRREVLLETLSHLRECGLQENHREVFVVDNASTDGTAAVLAERYPEVRVLALPDNRGSCAKGLALPHAKFRYVMFLDDDSWPLGDSVLRMVDRLESMPSLAAAGFVARLPDGRMECSAMPGVFIGCGVGFRRDALLRVGGIDAWFFMQAEEYDLAFRLVNAGYQVRVFDDLAVRHLKTPQARYRAPVAYYDIRNNVVLVCRYLRQPWLGVYLADWVQRYAWLSRAADCSRAYLRGLAAGLWRATRDRLSGRFETLSPRAFERFFCIKKVETEMAKLHERGVRRVLLSDLGKNVFAFWRAAAVLGIQTVAIADDRLASPDGRRYRGTPILSTTEALTRDFDAVVVSNTSYVHAAERAHFLRSLTDRPVYDWFGRAPTGGAES